ncbi:MAG: Ppx/GppA family phosphatase [Erythrobacter sp.]|nr:Ppx/GppA family phosphatase [Erythrobacter sp.]
MALRRRGNDRDGVFSGSVPHQAIIDIGSNTVRLVIYGGSPRAPTVLFNEKVAARLGRDITTTGALAEEAIALAMRGIERYALLLHDIAVTDVEVVATAAVREASNGSAFLEGVRALGFVPKLLSGEEEARLSAWGIIGAFPKARGIVADLGGGSLELLELENGEPGRGTSLPLGTLRLPELKQGDQDRLYKTLLSAIDDTGMVAGDGGDLYLVGGTWRAMAVYAMEERDFPLTDPHGLRLPAREALEFATSLAGQRPEELRESPRISTMRSASMPDAAVLLQALIAKLQPRNVIVSAWGLREGIVFSGLEPHARTQDPLIAGVSTFANSRGATPTMSAKVAFWTVDVAGGTAAGTERLRLAATMLALATMQIEPNLRMRVGVEWALHKRWLAISPQGRAMLAAAICANGNYLELPDEVTTLTDKANRDQAIGWGLAIRLCRRLGARSRESLQRARLQREDGSLVLTLEESHAPLYGLSQEKDMGLLADWLNLSPEVRIVERVGSAAAVAVAGGGSFE